MRLVRRPAEPRPLVDAARRVQLARGPQKDGAISGSPCESQCLPHEPFSQALPPKGRRHQKPPELGAGAGVMDNCDGADDAAPPLDDQH